MSTSRPSVEAVKYHTYLDNLVSCTAVVGTPLSNNELMALGRRKQPQPYRRLRDRGANVVVSTSYLTALCQQRMRTLLALCRIS